MAFILSFILVCLSSVSMCQGSWDSIPRIVATTAQQCINHGFSGECLDRWRAWPFTNPAAERCQRVRCAQPSSGHYVANTTIKATDGSYCGRRMACKEGKCVRMPKTYKATFVGSRKRLLCGDERKRDDPHEFHNPGLLKKDPLGVKKICKSC